MEMKHQEVNGNRPLRTDALPTYNNVGQISDDRQLRPALGLFTASASWIRAARGAQALCPERGVLTGLQSSPRSRYLLLDGQVRVDGGSFHCADTGN